MKQFFALLLIILLTIGFSIPLLAQTYYVDFESGSDTSDGLSPVTAWKHAPGDANAAHNPGSVVLSSGATVIFKNGVNYRGTITMKYSGAAGVPITYKGESWGSEKAVIDGADTLETVWTACQSVGEVFDNPNWQNIYYTSYTGDISPFNQIFENGERAYIAQTPNMSDPFWDDQINEYFTVLNGNITRTSLKDDIFLTQAAADYWNSAYIQMWVQPNVIAIKKIISFDPGSHTVYYDSLSSTAIYGDRDQYYSMVNHLSAIDRPGEYVVDETDKKIYYWPYGDIETCKLSISVRNYGIGFNGCSNICIENLKLQGFTSDGAAHAVWNNRTWGDPAENIIIRNNEITHTRTRDGRKGAISLSNVDGATIENNYIHDCQRNSGILIGAKNISIKNNQISKVGYKGIWSMGSEHLQILNNSITECEGTHGNPVSVFTTTNSLTANNFMQATSEVFTFEKNTDMVVHNNIIIGTLENDEENGTNIIRQNGSASSYCYGYAIITNNTLLYSNTNNAIGITSYFDDLGKVSLKNNISDGGPGHETSMQMSRANNLYTGLSWSQEERYGWSLMAGEFIQADLDSIFISHSGSDYRLSENSCARNCGLNPVTIIPAEIKAMFPDYDFSLDYNGNLRGWDGYFDLGALEYQNPDGLNDKNELPLVFSLSQNYPNPFNPITNIEFQIANYDFVTLKIYDILGRKIITLVNGAKPAGKHTAQWNGKNTAGQQVGSGIYYYQIQTGDRHISAKKMLFIR
ncbi:MAG: right-handed parallel beta-helix repeat-containing protein [Calditrichaceae bacterium]|nr:right-handed parallel beta-helix repeat-containing protein [Calditrichaceae bacterium]